MDFDFSLISPRIGVLDQQNPAVENAKLRDFWVGLILGITLEGV